jgi:hypothetical protein
LLKIKNEIYEANVKKLSRSTSQQRATFAHNKFKDPDNKCFSEAFSLSHRRRTDSLPSLLDFHSYKFKHGYFSSKWSTNNDDFYDNEREWAREIWNVWFDEIVPKIDGPKAHVEPIDLIDTGVVDELNDQVDSEKQRRVLASPTPYESYRQIDLNNQDELQIEPEMVDLLKREIEKMNKSIKDNPNAFDLARRGTLYRKVG